MPTPILADFQRPSTRFVDKLRTSEARSFPTENRNLLCRTGGLRTNQNLFRARSPLRGNLQSSPRTPFHRIWPRCLSRTRPKRGGHVPRECLSPSLLQETIEPVGIAYRVQSLCEFQGCHRVSSVDLPGVSVTAKNLHHRLRVQRSRCKESAANRGPIHGEMTRWCQRSGNLIRGYPHHIFLREIQRNIPRSLGPQVGHFS